MRLLSLILTISLLVPSAWAKTPIDAIAIGQEYISGKLTSEQVVQELKAGSRWDIVHLIETVTASDAPLETQKFLLNSLTQAMISDLSVRTRCFGIGTAAIGGAVLASAAAIGYSLPPDPAALMVMTEMGVRLQQAMGAIILTGGLGALTHITLAWVDAGRTRRRVVAIGLVDRCAKALGGETDKK